jgi:hypothetical protein
VIIRAADSVDLLWFQHMVECYLTTNANGIVAEEDGKTLAMVALDDWTPKSVHVHFYQCDVRAMPLLWKELLWYISLHGRKLICAVTPASRELSLRLQRALGFQEVYRQVDGWDDGVDMVVTELKVDTHGHELGRAPSNV